MDGGDEAIFRGLFEAAPDAILCVGPDGRIVLANSQAERLFGYDRHELVGELIEILVPESARAVHPLHRDRYVAEPRPRPMGAGMELAARRKDGGEFPAEISLSAISTRDGMVISAAIRDLTDRIEAQLERERLRSQAERERLERQLHQSQRLESLGQLAGGVAHDFNNLLLVIRNYASFVSEELAAAEAEREHADWSAVRADADQVIAAADRATRLTHQLLAFGRREVVHPRALLLNEVISDLEELLRRTLGEHVELSTELGRDLHRTMADPGQVEQVLVNLAVNARDAMPNGGTLLLRTTNVEVADDDDPTGRGALEPGSYVRLDVVDTGAGMHADVVERAFEPFFTTKPKGEGTGLGLATVYGIVAQAGGEAVITSAAGEGTTFTAFLPATDAPTPEPTNPPPPPARVQQDATILLVEDEDAVRELTSRILTRHGYRVIATASGAEALEVLREEETGRIDLLLTDVVMPQMLGKEVAERVLKERPTAAVVYMSGYAQPVLGSEGTLEPGVVLLEKPFTEESLVSVVRRALP